MKENKEDNVGIFWYELASVVDEYQLQRLMNKHQVTEDAEYEIVEPKKAFDENVLDFMNVGDDLRKAVYNAHSLDVYNGFKELVEPIKIDNNKTEQK